MFNLSLVILVASLSTLIAPALADAPISVVQPSATYARLTFVAADGLALSYVRYPAPSPDLHPIVIAPGAGESAYRWDDFVGELRARGYGPIFILEHRGQGYSAGSGVRTDLVHIDRFSRYVADFLDFVHGPVKHDLASLGFNQAPDVIAHSMGGAIANLALAEDPYLVRKIVYVSPMMDINTSILNPMHDRLALWAAEALCATGFCERLAVAGLGRARRLKIPGVSREIEEGIFRGGVTPGWLAASIRATNAIRKQTTLHSERALMITALRDRLVQNSALRTYAKKARNCSLLEIDGPHGLHHDGRSRFILLDAIDGFFRTCEDELKVEASGWR